MKCTLVERDARFWDADAGTARKDATFFLEKEVSRERGKEEEEDSSVWRDSIRE